MTEPCQTMLCPDQLAATVPLGPGRRSLPQCQWQGHRLARAWGRPVARDHGTPPPAEDAAVDNTYKTALCGCPCDTDCDSQLDGEAWGRVTCLRVTPTPLTPCVTSLTVHSRPASHPAPPPPKLQGSPAGAHS